MSGSWDDLKCLHTGIIYQFEIKFNDLWVGREGVEERVMVLYAKVRAHERVS